MAKDLEYYLAQARRIEAHREAGVEKEIRKIYTDLLKDLRATLTEAYTKWGTDDRLTYADLQKAGYHARFLEEIQQRIDVATKMQAARLRTTVKQAYELAYKAMVEGVEKAGADYLELDKQFKNTIAISPEQAKAAVNNPVAGLTLNDRLEKQRKDIIYNIKQTVGVGLMNGDRYTTMAKRIADSLDGDYKKAIRIARTEAHRVKEAGRIDAATNVDSAMKNGTSGMRMVKIWKSMRDERVRPQSRRKTKKGWVTKMSGTANHMKMDGQVRLADELFDLGGGITAMAPGQSGDAGNDINCRCYASYKMMTDAEYFKLAGKHFPDNAETRALAQEKQLLSEQSQAQVDLQAAEAMMKQLEQEQFVNIWKNPVTAKDYEALKDRLPAKRDYFKQNGKQDMLDLCDRFEEQGKKYMAAKSRYDVINKRLDSLGDEIKEARKKLMVARGIDLDKIKDEVADLESRLATLKQGGEAKLVMNKKLKNFDQDELKAAFKSIKSYYGDDTIEHVLNNYADDTLSKFLKEEIYWKEDIEKFKDFLKANLKTAPDKAAVEAMEKLLKSKQDELAAIMKRYGLEEDRFSQARKDKAYWFTGSDAHKRGDQILRPDTAELWRNATQDERYAAYRYTKGSGPYNRPLRGYDSSWYSYKGVGNVPLDNEGHGKEIKDLTNLIDRNPSKFDIWLQRGVESSEGAASFLGITEKMLDCSEKELQDLLLEKVVKDEAFTSSAGAKGSGFNGRMILNIYAPKGTKFIYAEPFSHYGRGGKLNWDGISGQTDFGYEFEVLVQKGTSYKIKKIEKKGWTIYADVDIVAQD